MSDMSGMPSFDDATGLERVTASLRHLPAVDARAADRVVAAALHRQRVARRQRTWLATAAGLVLAAATGAGGTVLYQRSTAPAPAQETLVQGPAAPASPAPVESRRDIAAGPLQLASTRAEEDAPVPVSFVLRRPGAKRVALVGDFVAWSPTAIPMKPSADGTWTVTVELSPGRHVYAFVVDDAEWVTDPRSQKVRDPDYGREQSVIVVGQP